MNDYLSLLVQAAPYLISGGGLIAYLAQPTREILKGLRTDLDKLKSEVDQLRAQNTALSIAFGAVVNGYEDVSKQLAAACPHIQVPTVAQLLERAKVSIQQVLGDDTNPKHGS